MKRHFTILLFVSFLFEAAHAQVYRSGDVSLQREQMHVFGGQWNKRWQFSTFGSLSFSNNLFNRGGFSALAMPVGMQLSRQLNKNWYTFGRMAAVPAFFNFTTAFNHPGSNKGYPGDGIFTHNSFGVSPRAEAGLFYINDQKTFSISGSMFIEQGNPVFYPPSPSPYRGVK